MMNWIEEHAGIVCFVFILLIYIAMYSTFDWKEEFKPISAEDLIPEVERVEITDEMVEAYAELCNITFERS